MDAAEATVKYPGGKRISSVKEALKLRGLLFLYLHGLMFSKKQAKNRYPQKKNLAYVLRSGIFCGYLFFYILFIEISCDCKE